MTRPHREGGDRLLSRHLLYHFPPIEDGVSPISGRQGVMNEPLCGLNYWVRFGAGINPCPVLRRRALRLDGSNWLIHRSRFPHRAFAEMQQRAGGPDNMRYWINEFAPSAQEGLLEQAAFAMRLKLKELVADLSASIISANEKLETAGTRKERERQEKNREAAVKRCKKALEELEEASVAYSLPTEGLAFSKVADYAAQLERSQYQQTEAIAALAAQVIGTEMEAAAIADDVPAGILADFVEDHGRDATAARIAIGQISPESEFLAIEKLAISMIEELGGLVPAALPAPPRQDEPLVEVTYARLDDGTWGVRSTSSTIGVGHFVIAVRSSGQRQRVRITGLDRRYGRSGVSLWTFEPAPEPKLPEPTILPPAQPKPVEPKPEVTVSTLANKGGWNITYRINCKVAVVERSYRGEPVETLTMSREQARHHYAAMQAQGYSKPGSDI